jgi:hypothetical protein
MASPELLFRLPEPPLFSSYVYPEPGPRACASMLFESSSFGLKSH